MALSACSDDNDRGDGFKVTKTQATQTTKPSATYNIDQPCSLVPVAKAVELMTLDEKTLGEPESSQVDEHTLRCRYAATTADGKLYRILNIYVYKDQASFDQVKKANDGIDIRTSYDEGFDYQRSTSYETEIFVAARDGSNRVALSGSISAIDPNTTLTPDQITLPDVNEMAKQVGLILYTLQKQQ